MDVMNEARVPALDPLHWELAQPQPPIRGRGDDMEPQERLQYQGLVNKMLGAMVSAKGSDLFLTAGFPPAIKLNGKLTKLNETALSAEHTSKMARAIASEKQW